MVGCSRSRSVKKMLTPNYGCVRATYKFTSIYTIFSSLVMFCLHVDNCTTIAPLLL